MNFIDSIMKVFWEMDMRKWFLLWLSLVVFIVACLLFTSAHAGRVINRPVIGWISFKPSKTHYDIVSISARAYAFKASSGRFILTVKRKNAGGVATSRQNGEFSIRRGQMITLSKTSLNMPRSSVFKARLELIIEGRVVFSAVLDNKL